MAPDGVGTISDAFDSAPNFMKTEDAYDFAKEDFGFTGRDEAQTFEKQTSHRWRRCSSQWDF